LHKGVQETFFIVTKRNAFGLDVSIHSVWGVRLNAMGNRSFEHVLLHYSVFDSSSCLLRVGGCGVYYELAAVWLQAAVRVFWGSEITYSSRAEIV
jgi:hypothetical protein